MAKNPMQRKAQNSFLLGMLITLLITGAIIGILVMQLTKITKEQQAEEEQVKQIYVVSEDIESGDEVSLEKLKLVSANIDAIPSNALKLSDLEEKINVTDEDGNLIKKANVVAKINLNMGTIITTDMIKVENELSADVRKMEYNMITLSSQLESGKYIDIRLRLPNGKDYIVVSHKKVEIPTVDGIESENTICLNLQETEILTLSCAIVESYKMEGAKLYATEYIEPGLQDAATATYLPDDATINLINQDPNCVEAAKYEIFKRNNNSTQKSAVRNPINSAINQNSENALDDVIDKVEEEIKTMQQERQKYLESLGAY